MTVFCIPYSHRGLWSWFLKAQLDTSHLDGFEWVATWGPKKGWHPRAEKHSQCVDKSCLLPRMSNWSRNTSCFCTLHEKVQRKQNNKKKKKNRESCRRKDQRGGVRQMVFSKAERNYMHMGIDSMHFSLIIFSCTVQQQRRAHAGNINLPIIKCRET